MSLYYECLRAGATVVGPMDPSHAARLAEAVRKHDSDVEAYVVHQLATTKLVVFYSENMSEARREDIAYALHVANEDIAVRGQREPLAPEWTRRWWTEWLDGRQS